MALNTLTTGATALLHTAQTALHSVVGSEPNHGRSIQKEIRVKKLFVHPIKSCRGSSVQEAHYDESELELSS